MEKNIVAEAETEKPPFQNGRQPFRRGLQTYYSAKIFWKLQGDADNWAKEGPTSKMCVDLALLFAHLTLIHSFYMYNDGSSGCNCPSHPIDNFSLGGVFRKNCQSIGLHHTQSKGSLPTREILDTPLIFVTISTLLCVCLSVSCHRFFSSYLLPCCFFLKSVREHDESERNKHTEMERGEIRGILLQSCLTIAYASDLWHVDNKEYQ